MSALTAPVLSSNNEKLAGLWDRAVGQYQALSPFTRKVLAGSVLAPAAMATGGLGLAGLGSLYGVGALSGAGSALLGGLGMGAAGYATAGLGGIAGALASKQLGRAAGATAGVAHGLPGLLANRGAQGARYLAPKVREAGKDLVTGIRGLPDRYRMHQFKMQQDAIELEKKRQELLRSRGLWAHARDSIESKLDDLVMGARARFGKTSEWVLDAPVFEKEALLGGMLNGLKGMAQVGKNTFKGIWNMPNRAFPNMPSYAQRYADAVAASGTAGGTGATFKNLGLAAGQGLGRLGVGAAGLTAGLATGVAEGGARIIGKSLGSWSDNFANAARQPFANAMSPAVKGRGFLSRGWNRVTDFLRPQVRTSTLPQTAVAAGDDVAAVAADPAKASLLPGFTRKVHTPGGRSANPPGQKDVWNPGMANEVVFDASAHLGPNAKLLSGGQIQDMQAGISSAVQNMRMSNVPISKNAIDTFVSRTPGQSVEDFVTHVLKHPAGTAEHAAAVKGFKQIDSTLAGARGRADTLAGRVDITRDRLFGNSELNSAINSSLKRLNKQNLGIDANAFREQMLQRANDLAAKGDFVGQQNLLKEIKALGSGNKSVNTLQDQMLAVSGGGRQNAKILADTRAAMGIDDLPANIMTGNLTQQQTKLLADAAARDPGLAQHFGTLQSAPQEIANLQSQLSRMVSSTGKRAATPAQIQAVEARLQALQTNLQAARTNINNMLTSKPDMFDAAVSRASEPLAAVSRADDLARIGAPARRSEHLDTVAASARRGAEQRLAPKIEKIINKRIREGKELTAAEQDALQRFAENKSMTVEELLARVRGEAAPGGFMGEAGGAYEATRARMAGLHAPPSSPGAAAGASPLAPPTSAAPGVPSGAAALTAPTMPSWMPQYMQSSPQAALATGLGGGMLLSNAMN